MKLQHTYVNINNRFTEIESILNVPFINYVIKWNNGKYNDINVGLLLGRDWICFQVYLHCRVSILTKISVLLTLSVFCRFLTVSVPPTVSHHLLTPPLCFWLCVCRWSGAGHQCKRTETQTLVRVSQKQREESGVLAYAHTARSPEQWQTGLDYTRHPCTHTHTHTHTHTNTHRHTHICLTGRWLITETN